jgi:5'-deoxynucleotidase YfbR-like HD superfamily hydrolase
MIENSKTEASNEGAEMRDVPRTYYAQGAIYHEHSAGHAFVKATVGQLLDAAIGYHAEAYHWLGVTVMAVPEDASEWTDDTAAVLVEEHGLPSELADYVDEWITARFAEVVTAA